MTATKSRPSDVEELARMQRWLTKAWAAVAALDRQPKPEPMALLFRRQAVYDSVCRTMIKAKTVTECINGDEGCGEMAVRCPACIPPSGANPIRRESALRGADGTKFRVEELNF